MTERVRLLVCQGCTFGVPKKERGDHRGGERLLQELRDQLRGDPLEGIVVAEPISCLANCLRSCTVSIDAPGRYSWVFGELPGPEVVPDLLGFLRRYLETPKGKVRKADRPESLREETVMARIPPQDA
jgi:predicted metal-binding protein